MKSKKIISLLFCIFSIVAQHKKELPQLVSVRSINKNIKIECWYATYNNFTGQQIYPSPFFSKCFLLKNVARALSNVQKELELQGLGLLIWDAFRPMEPQKKLWEVFPVEGFVAPPHKGGRHTRGTTVDLTIIHLETQQPLDMGTGFDVFIDRAQADNKDISQKAQSNRKLLQTVMGKQGFTVLPTEWWHFDYFTETTRDNYPPLNISFKELEELEELEH